MAPTLPVLRRVPIALALALLVAGPPLAATTPAPLPELGSSAAGLITPADEARFGAMVLRELRRQDALLEDPLIEDWLNHIGFRVAAASDQPEIGYTFFMLRDRRINAFATLGGLVGMNAGLVLAAEREDEVAGVLAHEVAHITQRHVLRAVERAQRNQLPVMLAMLGAIAAASQSNARNSTDAIGTAVVGAQALMMQMQLAYSRSNEAEADRIGIEILARAGFDPTGIADFFGRLARVARNNQGGWQMPEYLRTHPVTTTRIAEARDRAEAISRKPRMTVARGDRDSHLLLPPHLLPDEEMRHDAGKVEFAWARERLRVLSASSPRDAIAEFEAAGAIEGSSAQRYGYALALLRAQRGAEALAVLETLLDARPDHLWLRLAAAEAAHLADQRNEAKRRFEALVDEFPGHRAVGLTYARVLIERGDSDSARRAQSLLRPLLAAHAQDPALQQLFARASELSGDHNRAREAHAESAFLSGRAEDALRQLAELKERDDVDYVQRARVEARMTAMMPVVLEMRRLGFRPQDQGRPRDAG